MHALLACVRTDKQNYNVDYHNPLLYPGFLGVYRSGRYIIIPLLTNFPEICALIIGFSFTVWTKNPRKKYGNKRMLTTFVSIGSYSPEVRAFGTLITSTKVFSLIISKTL